MTKISASMFAADHLRLFDDAMFALERADSLHVDVMDGGFVPNFALPASFGPLLRRETGVRVDVHLMVNHPARYVQDLAGVDMVYVHPEADGWRDGMDALRSEGITAGLAINPETEVDSAHVALADSVLIMTVHPGFCGQELIPEALAKVARVRKIDPTKEIVVDGGITWAILDKTGADFCVMGSAFFKRF